MQLRRETLEPYQKPEMLRTSLHNLCLRAKHLSPMSIQVPNVLLRACVCVKNASES
jgi:HrpA-like RNA helicase